MYEHLQHSCHKVYAINSDIIRNYIRKQGRNTEQLKLSDF